MNTGQLKEKIKTAKKQIKEAFDPNDVSGIVFKTSENKKYENSKDIQVPKRQNTELEKMYALWGQGKISANEIKQYQKEHENIKKSANEVSSKYNLWTNILARYYAYLDIAKAKMSKLKQEIDQSGTSQNKLTSFFNKFKQKIEQTRSSVFSMKDNLNKISSITLKITNNIKSIGTGLKNGLGTVFKYAGALFSISTIYNALKDSANAWLSSQNSQAQQLSANIEYLKYAMGSVFAPVIEYVTNLIYQLMKSIQSLVYAFSGVNIFAKATASSMKSASSSASKASKSLAGVHSEINNISEKDSSGSSSVSPSFDLSEMDSSTNGWVEKIKAQLLLMFEPIKKSWSTYGQPLIESVKNSINGAKKLVESISTSLQEVWLNGTGTETVDLLLQGWTSIFNTIGNIGQAFSSAWESGNAGTSVVQSLWSSFNNLYSILIEAYQTFEEWTSSESFQTFANAIIGICKTISGWFEQITVKLKEIWENGGKETFTKLLEFISKLTEAVDAVLKFLDPVIQWVLDVVTPIIQGIIEVIGYVIDALSGVLDFIIGVFTGDWNRAWQGIKDFFSNVWNAIKTVVSTVFNAIKAVIITILNAIKNIWDKIWNGIKNTVINIWNGIWSGIKSVINLILGGIESFVNGIIRGVNFVLSGISKVANAVGSLIGLNPISLRLNTISLPRLAKGNVAYNETLAIFGEYAGASNNPEITTPQNIMRETFEDVLSNYNSENNNGPINLSVYVGNTKLGQILLDNLRDMKRQSGKDIEALVGG